MTAGTIPLRPPLYPFLGAFCHLSAGYRTRVPARVEAVGTPEDLIDEVCEHETVKLSLNNLRTFPWIAEREEAGLLQLHGFRFGIADGVLEQLQADGTFAAV